MNIYKFASEYDLNMLSDSDLEELQRQSDSGVPDGEVERRAVLWDQEIRREALCESRESAAFYRAEY
jgi:hypothetical protein